MLKQIEIDLPELHPAQEKIIAEQKRFNVLKCGRRFGKTELSKDIAINAVLDKYPVGFWFPTYKDLEKVWESILFTAKDIIKQKNEALKHVKFITGGEIDFWSMDNPDSGRGNFYKVAIIDEAEKSRNFEQAWKQTIRPTLTDLKGTAWIMSTPKRVNSFFNTCFHNSETREDWMSWQMPTTANPFIDPLEVEEARNLLDPLSFRQEYMAESVSMADKPFFYCFEDRHIQPCELNPREPIVLSFDFNVDPMTCVIAQVSTHYIHILDEIRLRNSDIYEVCEHLKNKAWYTPNLHILVTGDASGFARSSQTKGNVNNYTIILSELRLNASQLKVPKSNPPISESRTLSNSILSKHLNVKFNPSCKYIIEDMRYVQVKEDGGIDKTSDAFKSHFADNIRYIFNTFKHDFILRGNR